MAIFYFSNTPHAKSRQGEHIATQNHFGYITREGKYGNFKIKREELVYSKSGNLPGWANNAKEFWCEAETHRRKNGRAYREIRLGLQEEFTLEENIELVNKFLKEAHISTDHVYTYAIHDKIAAFDPNHRNIHAHIMFNEKTIEKDRPLSADQFFAQYRTNDDGEVTGGSGYYNDPWYKKKEFTVEMRKKWADIVNDKFKEKGMDTRISEKTLVKQAEELRKEGRYNEATLLDRKPVPHMGKMYRNSEKQARILELEKEIEHEAEVTAELKNSDPTYEEISKSNDEERMMEADREEAKMIMFAIDALIRRVAKEIQEERAKARREEKAMEAEKDPMVITAADLTAAMEERAEAYRSQGAAYFTSFQEERKQTFKDAILYEMAKDKIVPGYKDAKNKYHKSLKELTDLEKYINQEKAFFHTVPLKVQQQWQEAGLLNAKLKEAYDTKEAAIKGREGEVHSVYDTLKAENEKHLKAMKKNYRKYIYFSKEGKLYLEKVQYIKENFKPDTIIYSEPLPDAVGKNLKYEGRIPLKKMPKVNFHGGTYYILTDISNMKKDGTLYRIHAVRDGAPVFHGKTNATEMIVGYKEDNTANGKSYWKLNAEEAKETSIEVKFYKIRNVEKKADARDSNTRPVENGFGFRRSKSYNERSNAVGKAIDRLVDANKDAPNGRLIRWQDLDENRKLKRDDEYEKTVAELEAYERGLHLGRR